MIVRAIASKPHRIIFRDRGLRDASTINVSSVGRAIVDNSGADIAVCEPLDIDGGMVAAYLGK